MVSGADHVMFGSDFPAVPIPLKRSVDAVRELSIVNAGKEMILGGNCDKAARTQRINRLANGTLKSVSTAAAQNLHS